MRIKVCGMTSAEQVLQLDEMGVEFAGFIFYPKSPRYVYKYMPRTDIKKIKGKGINKVGVFVNAPVEEVLEAVDVDRKKIFGNRFCGKFFQAVRIIRSYSAAEEERFLYAQSFQHVPVKFFAGSAISSSFCIKQKHIGNIPVVFYFPQNIVVFPQPECFYNSYIIRNLLTVFGGFIAMQLYKVQAAIIYRL